MKSKFVCLISAALIAFCLNGCNRKTGCDADGKLISADTAVRAPSIRQNPEGMTPEELMVSTDTVACISGYAVPYEWFLHEFRSSYFRYNNDPQVRDKVFNDFLEKMILYSAARQEGMPDEALQQSIDAQIEKIRAYMQYQLVMTEINTVVKEFLAKQGMAPESFAVTDDEILMMYNSQTPSISDNAASLSAIPDEIKERIRYRIQIDKQKNAVKKRVDQYWGELMIDVNTGLVSQVPFPTVIKQGPQ